MEKIKIIINDSTVIESGAEDYTDLIENAITALLLQKDGRSYEEEKQLDSLMDICGTYETIRKIVEDCINFKHT